MIAKQFAFAGLTAVGNIASGSGSGNTGVPLGPVANWAALPVSGDEGATATVTTLGTAGSSGTATYTSGAWRLTAGVFATVADMTAFASPIATGAVASVALATADGVRYVYDGAAWVRSAALTDGYAWPLSSTRDFSAVGLRDGDFGIYTPASGLPVLLRYVAACPAVGGGTLPAWVHPDLYGRANLSIVCYVEGSETPPAYGGTLQGYQYDRTASATITSVGGHMRLDAPAPGAGSQVAFMTGPNISGAKRFYVQTEMRGVTAGSVGQAGLFNLSAVPQSQWALASQRDVAGGVVLPVFWNGSVFAAALTGTSVRNGGGALPASTPWLAEGFSSGGAITDMMVTRIDGYSYCSLRRNFDSATTGTNFNIVPLAVGNVSGASSGQLEMRNHFVFTSD